MALKMKFVNTADPSDYVVFPIIRGHINNYDGTKISSSIIKQYIREGNVEEGNRFLGYNFYIKGG